MKAKTSLLLLTLLTATLPAVAADFKVVLVPEQGVDVPALSKASLYADLKSRDGSGPLIGLLPIIEGQTAMISVPQSELKASKKYNLIVGVCRQPRFQFDGEMVVPIDRETEDGILELKVKAIKRDLRRYRLVDSDGRPIKDQPVQLLEGARGVASAVTDEDAQFQFETWRDRKYEIVSKPGGRVGLFKTIDVPKQPQGNGVVDVSFARPPVGAIGTLEIVEGEKLRRATEFLDKIFISGDGGKAVWVVNTDEATFDIPNNLPAGEYGITASPDSAYMVVRGGTLTIDPKVPLRDLSLVIAHRKKVKLELFTKRHDGSPVGSASIFIFVDGSRFADAVTDARGRALLELHEGEYVVRAYARSFTQVSRDVALREDAAIDLVLREQVALKFLVTDATGAPVADALVNIAQKRGGQKEWKDCGSKNSDQAGMATIESVDTGDAVASALKAGFPFTLEKIRVEGDDLVRLRMTAGVEMSGRVILGELAEKASQIFFVEPKLGMLAGGSEIDKQGHFKVLMADGVYDAYVPVEREFVPLGKLTVKESRKDIQYTVDQAAIDAIKSSEEVFGQTE